MRFLVATTLALLILPGAIFAQSGNDLRTQIRADLAADPRASQMSDVEFNALVEALATQATEEGTASDYLDTQNSFDYTSLFEAANNANGTSFAPILLALTALFAILVAVGVFIIRNRGKRLDEPSDVAA